MPHFVPHEALFVTFMGFLVQQRLIHTPHNVPHSLSGYMYRFRGCYRDVIHLQRILSVLPLVGLEPTSPIQAKDFKSFMFTNFITRAVQMPQ